MQNTNTYAQSYNNQAYANQSYANQTYANQYYTNQAYTAQSYAQPAEERYIPIQKSAYQPHYSAPKAKVPGRAGAIARLIMMYLIAGFGVIAGIINLFTSDADFGYRFLDSLNSIGLLMLTPCVIWIFMKWVVFMAPKSFGLAKRMWQSWHALTIFGLYLKCVAFLLISIPPISVITLAFMPLSLLMSSILTNGLTLLSGLGMILAGGVFMAVLTFLDVCKLRGTSPMDAIKALLAGRKH